MPNRIVMGFDPGDTTGWSSWNWETGEPIAEGQFFQDVATEWFIDREPFIPALEWIVIEDFRLLKGVALQQSGSTFVACQVIGMIKLWAARGPVKIKVQPPSIKHIAERYTQRRPVGAHSKSHSIDAYNHVAYFLTMEGRYKTALAKEKSL